MKRKHLIIILACFALLGAYALSIAPNFRRRSEWNRTAKTLQGLSPERVKAGLRVSLVT